MENNKQKFEKPRYELRCFVSSQFTKRLNHVHRVLNGEVSQKVAEITGSNREFRHQFTVSWKRLDEEPFIAENIQRNVLESIRESHFVVADISPQFHMHDPDCEEVERQSPNPSVMHELGYATALGIPVF